MTLPTIPLPDLLADLRLAYRRTGTSLRAQVPGVRRLATEASADEPLTEEALDRYLLDLLPGIVDGLLQARAAYGDGRLSLAEAAALGTTLLGIVSRAVMRGAPLVQGQHARQLVLLIFGTLWARYVVPALPVWLRPFAPLLRAAVTQGLEVLYRTVVRPVPLPTP